MCPICSSSHYRIIYNFPQALSPLDIAGLIAQCLNCKGLFKIVHNPKEVGDAYGNAYKEDKFTQEYFNGNSTRRFYRKILNSLCRPTASKSCRILDIGAGEGVLLEEAIQMG